MLEFKSIAFKNFLSYGAYVTEIDLSNLGPCLIRGVILDSADKTKTSNGAGKCLDGSTLVLMADGRRIPISDLHDHIGEAVISISASLKQTNGVITNWCRSGIKRCFEVTTRSGRKLICSSDHRLLTFNGWKPLSDISLDDFLAVNKKFTIKSDRLGFCTLAEAELLGLMLGDGCFFKHTPTICISDDEPEIKKRVEFLIKQINSGLELRADAGTHKGKSYRIVINGRFGKRIANPLRVWFDSLGLTGKTKGAKFIPNEFDSASIEHIKAIIAGFWAADGTINIGKNPKKNRKRRVDISATNKSEQLIRTLQHYLLRLDIRSRIRSKNALCTTSQKRFSTFILEISTDSKLLFLEIFGDYLKNLGCPVDESVELIALAGKQQFRSGNTDLIPGDVWKHVEAQRLTHCLSWRTVAPPALALAKANYLTNRRSTGRSVIHQFATSLQSSHLLDLATSDIVWDEIIAIKDVGERETYDISVATDNCEPNFSANDIVTHNSGLINAILWCLFGRTMHSAKPGSKILHFFNKEDCWAQLTFKNGDIITRTYGRNGKSELTYEKDGQSAINTTLATTGHEQRELNKLLDLDWDIFCGSTFCTQYSVPWLEMSDQKRKKAIERVLHLDRFTIYAEVAKKKKIAVESEHNTSSTNLAGLERMLADQLSNLKNAEEASSQFDDVKLLKHNEYLKKARESEAARDNVELQDIDKLKEQWDTVAKIEKLIAVKEDSVNELYSQSRKISQQISQVIGEIKPVEAFINSWYAKAGKICSECEQSIPHAHTEEKTKPKLDELDSLRKKKVYLETELSDLNSQIKKLNDNITKTKVMLNSSKPAMTLREAAAINNERQTHDDAAKEYQRRAEDALKQVDPNLKLVEQLKKKIGISENEIASSNKALKRMDVLVKHYSYLNKLYSDRKKIKSSVIADHIPYFNRRLHDYLDAFELDIRVELTDSLSIESNMWGYEFESGGERRRTDVAFSMAMFDLHSEIYGRQSNVVVLDEVDGRMDQAGVDFLVDIINNDIASKVETVLVISHKQSTHDVFPREITIGREGRLSRVIETR